MRLAQHFGMRKGESILKEVQSTVAEWDRHAEETGVGKDNIRKIKSSLEAIADN
jgi:hypothetical protein